MGRGKGQRGLEVHRWGLRGSLVQQLRDHGHDTGVQRPHVLRREVWLEQRTRPGAVGLLGVEVAQRPTEQRRLSGTCRGARVGVGAAEPVVGQQAAYLGVSRDREVSQRCTADSPCIVGNDHAYVIIPAGLVRGTLGRRGDGDRMAGMEIHIACGGWARRRLVTSPGWVESGFVLEPGSVWGPIGHVCPIPHRPSASDVLARRAGAR